MPPEFMQRALFVSVWGAYREALRRHLDAIVEELEDQYPDAPPWLFSILREQHDLTAEFLARNSPSVD